MVTRFTQSFESDITGSVAGSVRNTTDAMVIGKPAPGSVQIADVQRAFAIKFGFDFSDVKVTAVDVDLVFLFPDGSRLVLPGLALNLLSADPPSISFKEEQIEPAVMFSKLGDIKLVDHVLATSLTSGGEPDKTSDATGQGNGEASQSPKPMPMPTMGGTGTGQAGETPNPASPAPQSLRVAAAESAASAKSISSVAPTSTSKAKKENTADAPPVEEVKLQAKSSVRLFGVTEMPEVTVEGKAWVITNGFAAKPADTDASLSAQAKRMDVVGTDHADIINAADFSRVKPGETIRRVEFSATPIGAENTIATTIKINLPLGMRIDGMSVVTGNNGKDYYEFKTDGKNTVVFDLIYELPKTDSKLGEGGYYGTPKVINYQMIVPDAAESKTYYGTQTFVIAPRGENGPLAIMLDGTATPVLWSNPPDVSIVAGRGDDTIVASASVDLIDGGEGYDIVSYAKSNAAVRVSLENGGIGGYGEGDRYKSVEGIEGSLFADRLSGDAADNTFIGGVGADTIDGGAGNDTADYTGSVRAVAIDLNRTQQLGGDAQGDVLISIENVEGSAFGDLLSGNSVANKLSGNAGDDTLSGGGGDDTLDGGVGIDTADYSELRAADSVNITLMGDQSTRATIMRDGSAETDTLISIENVIGGLGADRIFGDARANRLEGGGGNDTLSGSGGDDTLDGGDGSDTVSYAYLGPTQRLSLTLSGTGSDRAAVFGALDLQLETDQLDSIENVVGGEGSDTISGSATANSIEGGAGDDLISGGGGDDTLDGGLGTDTVSYRYLGTGQNFSVNLRDDGSAIGRVFSATGSLLVQDQLRGFENIWGGGGNDSISGNATANLLDGGAGNDLIEGGDGNDTLIGGAGIDTLRGGQGDDVYVIDQFDRIEEVPGGGTDRVLIGAAYTSNSYRLAEALEEIDASGAERAMALTGNADDNIIIGTQFDDTLDAGDGDDRLEGGKGNDLFLANDGNDIFVGESGIDTVTYANIATGYRLQMFRETDGNLLVNVLNSAGQIIEADKLIGIEQIYGSSGADFLLGNSSANTLIGGSGNDTLDGGQGADYLAGGDGDDYYRIDKDDTIFEAESAGIDTVFIGPSYFNDSFTLGANLEKIDASEAQRAMRLYGNENANTITGSSFADIMAGGGGNDVYILGAGDIVSENANEGIDTVILNSAYDANTYQLPDHIEIVDARGVTRSLSITGSASQNTILGGSGNDTLIGGGNNDLLDGGDGIDTADYSYLTDPAIGVVANLGTGSATVGGGVEIDTLVSIENLTGGAGNDHLIGRSGANTLSGGRGDDTLDGATGIDTADYSYVNENYSLIVDLARAGRNATVTGGLSDVDTLISIENIIGSDGDDLLLGNEGVNSLFGGKGDDTIGGGAGADILDGGAGENTLTYRNQKTGVNADPRFATTNNWSIPAHIILRDGFLEGNGQSGSIVQANNLQIGKTYNFSFDYSVTQDTVFSLTLPNSVKWSSGLVSGTGTLTGSFMLNPGDVTSLMLGQQTGTFSGTIANFYIADANAGVVIDLKERTASGGDAAGDQFTNFVHVEGSKSNDYLTGDDRGNRLFGDLGNDTLDGGLGNDTLIGGEGDDLYIVDEMDQIIESANGGKDTVRLSTRYAASTYTLADNVEILDASALNSSTTPRPVNLIGNAGHNYIIGTRWTETLQGGLGNDTYVISDSDIIIDTGGIDTVVIGALYSIDTYVMGSSIDVIDASDAIQGMILKSSSVVNLKSATIIGSAFDDRIYGNTGPDTLQGGLGNDSYYISQFDTIIEADREGDDTVIIDSTLLWNLSSEYTLGENLENLTVTLNSVVNETTTLRGNNLNNIITGSAGAEYLSGESGNDTLFGGGGNDTLDGGAGNDSLVGGSGNDVYLIDEFDTVSEAANEGIDTVKIGSAYRLNAYVLNAENVENIDATDAVTAMKLTGSAIANTIYGGAYNDTIFGGDGNDSLLGGLGHDSLRGGGGADTLLGESGNDLLFGDAGQDSLVGGAGNDTLDGGDDDDVLEGGDGDDLFIASGGNDTFVGGDGFDTGSYAGLAPGWRVDVLPDANGTFISRVYDAANNLIKTDTLIGLESVIGSSGNDTFLGDATANVFSGGAGNDTINGGGGNDKLFGDDGNDVIIGGAGNDTIDGGAGDDVLSDDAVGPDANPSTPLNYGSGNDSFFGGEGNDTLIGGLGDDTLDGGDGNDTASYRTATGGVTVNLLNSTSSGAAGNDTLRNIENLRGSEFDDTLTGDMNANSIDGGAGNDTLIGGLGNDTLNGGAGIDLVDYSTRSTSLNINLNNALNNAIVSPDEVDTLIGIENIRGGSGNDTIFGDGNDNLIEGGNGNDALSGGGGNDTLIGGAGNDTLDGGDGNDTLDYSTRTVGVVASLAGGTVVIAGAANETDYISNFEIVVGGSGNDSISGDTLNNTLLGGAGNDTISGGFGNDSLDGGTGVNTVDYSYTNSNLNFTLAANGTQITISAAAGSDVDIIRSFEHLILGSGNDNVTGNNLNNSIVGGNGNDTIDGFSGNDTLDGGAGNDSLIGGAGFDNLIGGTGDDTLDGGDNDDTLDGGLGNDSLIGGNGDDIFIVSGGDDTFIGGAGNDTLSYAGLASNVRVQFSIAANGDQIATLIDTSTNAVIETDTIRQIETIIGSNSNDAIIGGLGADSLLGGAGNDTIDGGAGNAVDTLNGQSGVNTLSYASAGGAVNVRLGLGSILGTISGAAGNDIVSNFTHIIGSAFSDTLRGNSENNSIAGGAGGDTLTGDLGNDTLDGGADNDTVDYSTRTAAISVDLGATGTIIATIAETISETDTLVSIENIRGGSGNDTIRGSSVANYLEGNGGDDSLTGGAGDDTLMGGAGNDVLDGGADNDLAIFTGNLADYNFSIDSSGALTVQDTITNRDGTDTLRNFESIQFLDGVRTLATLGNGGGAINLASETRAILAFTGSGADTITTGFGNDSVVSGSGADSIVTGLGNDTVFGGDGDDTINGGPGADSLDGGNGINTLSYETVVYSNGASARFDNGTGWTLGTANTSVLNIGSGRLNASGASGTLLTLALDTAGTYTYSFTYNNTGAGAITLSLNGITHTIGANASHGIVGTFTTSTPSFTLSVTAGSFTGWLDNLQIITGGVNINLAEGVASGGDAAGDTFRNFRHVIGSVGSDTIVGDAQDNLINGQVFSAGDSLSGGDGNDTIYGTFSTDTLNGGRGNDLMDGSSYGDFFQFDWSMASGQGWGQDTISAFEVNADKLVIRNLGMAVSSQAELDELFSVPTFVSGTPTLISLKGVLALGDTQTITLNGISNVTPTRSPLYADFNWSPSALVWIKGSMSAETLSGTTGNDTIVALGGDDVINASAGDDIIDGGSGNDTISYTAWNGPITINLGSNARQEFSAGAFQRLVQIERVIGSNFNDVITGGTGNDTLQGGGGDDVLDGGAGSADAAVFSGAVTGLATQAQFQYVFSTNASGQIIVADQNANRDGSDTLSNIEILSFGGVGYYVIAGNGIVYRAANGNPSIVLGGNGDDTLIGGGVTEILIAGAGNDSLRGHNGNDSLYGGDGDDTLNGGAGGDILDGGTGRNMLSYVNTQYANAAYGTFDTANGWTIGTGGSIILGTDTNPLNTTKGIYIGTAATGNLLQTTGLTTSLTYNFSIDINNTTAGALTFVVGGTSITAGVGLGTYTGSFTTDSSTTTFVLSTAGTFTGTIDNLFFLAQNAGVNVDLLNKIGSAGDAAGDSINNIQDVFGSLGNDTITGDGNDNSIDGWLGNDFISGGGGNDILNGGLGDDTLNGGAGNDIIDGGAGNDVAVFSGGILEYEFSVGTNNTLIIRDRVAGRDGTDTLSKIEQLRFAGGVTFNTSTSASGALVVGTNAPEVLSGTNGIDYIFGGGGNDSLVGSGTADSLNGGWGDDTLNGGFGEQIYVFDWSMIAGQGWGRDTIVNFEKSGTGEKLLIQGLGMTVANQAELDELFSFSSTTTTPITVGLKGILALGDVQTITVNQIQWGSVNLVYGNFTWGPISNPWIKGSMGVDVLNGTSGDDTIVALGGDDTVNGGAGNDILDGGSGNDMLIGGGGNDTLLGGLGNDTMILDVAQLASGSRADGGSGLDVFQFAAKASVTSTDVTLAQLDTLLDNTETLDFTGANNKINLAAIDLTAGSADRTALAGVGGGAAVTIRYNASGANDQDSFGAITGAAASDATGTAGTSGYTQNFYADAAKTQLLLSLIAA